MRKAMLAAVAALMLTTLVHAESKGGGGGNAVGNELFDFAESGTRVSVKSFSFYPIVQHVLQAVGEASPQFRIQLANAIEMSKWTLDKNPLNTTDCFDKSLSGIAKTVVACQNQIEIRFFEPWLMNPKVSARDKAALIIHEGVRRMGYSDPFVAQVTRDIFALDSGKMIASEFLEALNSYAGSGVASFDSKQKSCDTLNAMNDIVLNYPRSLSLDFSQQSLGTNDLILIQRMVVIPETPLTYQHSMSVNERVHFGLRIVSETKALYGCK